MPKTKFQSIVFTMMMVFCMVFCMTVYTVSINAGGLSGWVFGAAIREMWLEYIIVFALIFFIISPRALKLGKKFVPAGENSQLFSTLAIQSFTVMMIVPLITLIATFLHGGLNSSWFVSWITTAVLCFPMAYCLQVFFIGPFVRSMFRRIFA